MHTPTYIFSSHFTEAYQSLISNIQKYSNSDTGILDMFGNLLYTRNLEISPIYQKNVDFYYIVI